MRTPIKEIEMWYYGQEKDNLNGSARSPSYSALYYVLLFPKGENGWHPRIPIHGAQLRERGENTRQRDGEE